MLRRDKRSTGSIPTSEDVYKLINNDNIQKAFELSKRLASELTILDQCEDFQQAYVVCLTIAKATQLYGTLQKQPIAAVTHFQNAQHYNTLAESYLTKAREQKPSKNLNTEVRIQKSSSIKTEKINLRSNSLPQNIYNVLDDCNLSEDSAAVTVKKKKPKKKTAVNITQIQVESSPPVSMPKRITVKNRISLCSQLLFWCCNMKREESKHSVESSNAKNPSTFR